MENKYIKIKILVIDDDFDILIVSKKYLKSAGYEVDIAQTGQEGVQRYYRFKPDIILLDINMPGPDGFDICRKIRGIDDNATSAEKYNKLRKDSASRAKSDKTFIIFLTSQRSSNDVKEALLSGADDYIIKPFTAETLLNKIDKYVKNIFTIRGKKELMPSENSSEEDEYEED